MKYHAAFSGFSVPDITVIREFYGSVLGLDVREQPEGLEIKLPGGASVFVYHSETNKPADFTIINFVVADIDAAVDELVGKGVTMEQYDMGMIKTDEKGVVRNEGGEMGPKAIAWFKDPAGNILSVIQEK